MPIMMQIVFEHLQQLFGEFLARVDANRLYNGDYLSLVPFARNEIHAKNDEAPVINWGLFFGDQQMNKHEASLASLHSKIG